MLSKLSIFEEELAARAAHDEAKARAERQSLYLATYIRPTLAQRSDYPDRPVLMLVAALFLFLLWSVLVLRRGLLMPAIC